GRRVAASVGARPEALADDLTAVIGNPGTAQAGVLLADVLDRAEPGQVIVVVTLADGAEVDVFRTTAELAAHRRQQASTVREQIEAGRGDLPYATFLTWRGQLHRDPPRRPDPDRPAAPPALRHEGGKYGFIGDRVQMTFRRLFTAEGVHNYFWKAKPLQVREETR